MNHVRILPLAFCACFSCMLSAQLKVDCTKTDPTAFPTIGAALATVAGPGAVITINGPCTEDVIINDAENLWLGAVPGMTANLTGDFFVNGADGLYVYGLNVSNPNATGPGGDGFDIYTSRNVVLDGCTSNGNMWAGLYANTLSDVTILGPASFSSNYVGIDMGELTHLYLYAFNGPVDISNNHGGSGIWMTEGTNIDGFGNITIQNNAGFGLEFMGQSIAQFAGVYGPMVFQGNALGGIKADENSELSLWNSGQSYPISITNNGPVGIIVSNGAQTTLYNYADNQSDAIVISGHTGPAVDVFAGGKLTEYGRNLFTSNGSATDPRSAAVRLDGNSVALIRGGEFTLNQGPGILALLNSSADFTGASFSGNSGGNITCDSSSWMVSDLFKPNNGMASGCRTPHNLGNRNGKTTGHFMAPKDGPLKAKHAAYLKLASRNAR